MHANISLQATRRNGEVLQGDRQKLWCRETDGQVLPSWDKATNSKTDDDLEVNK